MSKKNKLILAAAICAMLILIGSGIARCTLANMQSKPTETAAVGTSHQEQSSTSSAAFAANEGLSSFIGTTWVGKDDPACALTIVKGAFVEEKEGENIVTYWTVDSESAEDKRLETIVLASKSMTDAAIPVLVVIEEAQGLQVIKSDALACTYTQVEPKQAKLSFSGITPELSEALGADEKAIEDAVASRAFSISPSCTRAIWDAEVWLDFANDCASSSFTLDDGASTIISVTRNADGSIEAL